MFLYEHILFIMLSNIIYENNINKNDLKFYLYKIKKILVVELYLNYIKVI